MRLDKFLKVSRIIKRRTVANEACDGGRILARRGARATCWRSASAAGWGATASRA